MGIIKPVFETSWGGMVKRSGGETERKESMRNPIKMDNSELHDLLKKGIVLFVYRKKLPKSHLPGALGKLRIAWGTKHFDSLPFPVPTMGGTSVNNHGGEIYIDLDAEDWRVAYETLGGFDHPFYSDEFERFSDEKKKKLETELLDKLGLFDEYTAQLEVERAKVEAKRKREEERLSKVGIEAGGDVPVDGEIA